MITVNDSYSSFYNFNIWFAFWIHSVICSYHIRSIDIRFVDVIFNSCMLNCRLF